MVTITSHAEGCLLAVRAQPGARKNAVVGEHSGALKIAVMSPPEYGRANEAIAALLKKWLGLKRAQVQLWSGARSRDKQFLIRSLDVAGMTALIEEKLT